MKLTIEIDSDNVGCETREDLCDIVARLVAKIRLAGTGSQHAIRDINGQTVGHYSVSGDEHDDYGKGYEEDDDEDESDE